MQRIYHPYWLWEDYINGMWRKESKEYEERMLPVAIEFTGDWIRYGKAMMRVIDEWPISVQHNLTDVSQNRKAWVGHSAVCLEIGIPEYLTRSAWGHLTNHQQYKANAAADRAIEYWERKITNIQTVLRF